MRLFLKILASFILTLFILVALLPSLISTQIGTAMFTRILNQQIPGKIEIQDLNLSWLKGQKVENFSLKGLRGNPIIQIGELELNRSLLSLLFQSPKLGEIRVINMNGLLLQDDRGGTNLEHALGLREFNEQEHLTPVQLENVNGEIKMDPDHNGKAKIVGMTHQNSIKGQFDLNYEWGNKQSLRLTAEQFPVLVLDQLLTIQDQRFSGLLQNLIGDSFDITINQTSTDSIAEWHVLAKSNFIDVKINGQNDGNLLTIKPDSVIRFNILEKQMHQLLAELAPDAPQPLQPFSGMIRFDFMQIPLNRLEAFTGKAFLNLDSNTIKFRNRTNPILLKQFQVNLDAAQDNSMMLISLHAQAQENGQIILLNNESQIQKTALFNSLPELLQDGIPTQGNLETEVTTPLGSSIKLKWDGIVREDNSRFNIFLDSEKLNLSDLSVNIEKLHSQDWLRYGQTAKSMNIIFSDMQNNKEKFRTQVRITPSHNQSRSDIHIQTTLRRFPTHILQQLLPEHNISEFIGTDINADLSATIGGNQDLEGQIDLHTLQNSTAFIKGLNGKFNLSHGQRDFSFEIYASQTQGTSQLRGNIYHLRDAKGHLRIEQASASLQGSLRHFPLALMTRIATGKQEIAEQLRAIFGNHVDMDISAEIQNRQGPVRTQVRGSNGQLYFDGKIQKGVLFLEQPLTLNVQVTKELENIVLNRFIPLFSPIIKAEKPIELIISKEGFSFPLNQLSLENLTIGQAELKLQQMWFGRDSQLGKIVSLLGVNTSTFEVWFTPIYFSLQDEQLNMQRVDMLVAQAYPFASWGSLNFERDQLHFVIGISGQALKKAFAVKGIKNSYILQIPVRGSIHKPQIDTAQAATRLSALVAQSKVGNGPQSQLIGTIMDTASDLWGNEKVPPPTTNPLPWAHSLQESPDVEEKSQPSAQKIVEKPIKKLKKEAKSILKGILGK